MLKLDSKGPGEERLPSLTGDPSDSSLVLSFVTVAEIYVCLSVCLSKGGLKHIWEASGGCLDSV